MVTFGKSAPSSLLSGATALTEAATALSTEFDSAQAVGNMVGIEVTLTYGVVTTGKGATLRVYCSQDQTWSGNEEISWENDIPLVVSDTVSNSFLIPALGRYMKFSVYNAGDVSITGIGISAQIQTVA